LQAEGLHDTMPIGMDEPLVLSELKVLCPVVASKSVVLQI